MANGTLKGNMATLLHELISAPLVAMVQADALAARATVEFVEDVGFLESAASTAGSPQAPALRMANFRFRKADETGELKEFEASIPLLALMPIPSLQIREGRVKLAAKIVDVSVETAPAAPSAPPARTVGSKLLAARRLNFVTKPVASSGSKTQETRGSFDLDIEITMSQADVPVGMEKIFQLMDSAINEKKVG